MVHFSQSLVTSADTLRQTDLCPPEVTRGAIRVRRGSAPSYVVYSSVASVAMRWALAMTLRVMVVAGMVGKTEASTMWTRFMDG